MRKVIRMLAECLVMGLTVGGMLFCELTLGIPLKWYTGGITAGIAAMLVRYVQQHPSRRSK